MMDHHRFIQPTKSSNVMIGGSASRSSDTTDDHTASDPVGANDCSTNPIPHSSVPIFGDDAFEKINMDFDLSGESSKPRSSDTSLASEMFLEKLYNSELKGMIEMENSPEDNSKIGISSKLGDIGDELNMDLLEDNLFPNGDYGDNNEGNDTINNYSLPSNPLHALISNDSSIGSLIHQAQEVTENSESSADQLLKLLPETGNGNSEVSIENMLMGNSDNSLENLINAPLIDMDSRFPDSSVSNNEGFGNNNNDKNRNSNTNNNQSFGLEHVGSSGSLSDSIGSLQTLGLDNRNSNEPFPVHTSSGSMNSVRLNSQVMNNSMNNSINISNNSRSTSAAVAQQQKQQMAARQQQQQALLMQRQQQLFLQQQQQMRQQQQQQLNNNSKKSAAASSIQSIVNDQLSQLPQVSQLTKLGVVGLEEEKLKLIRRLQQIEHSNMPLNTGQQQQRQQQQQQQQQQFLLQQQVLLKQQQLQLEQQKKQQLQQQQGASMPSLGTGGQITQGQMELQGQQQQQQQSNMGFAMNQQIMQQQQGGIAPGLLSPRPIATPQTQTSFFNNSNNMMNISNNNNDSNNSPGGKSSLQQQQTSIFSNTNGVFNDNNNKKMKANVSSVMGSQGKETPLLSFLRKNRGSSNNNNTMIAQMGQQQQPTSQAAAASLNTTNHSISSEGSLFDGTPIDYNAAASNPFLRQMMNNLDRSVNRNSSMRGQIGGIAGNGLSNLTRRNMMQQMSTSGQISKSCRELEKQMSTDSYESAGIIARHGSMDQIPTRRTGLTAGAAKAQNRRFTLNRSNNSFGNLNKSRSGPRREGPKRELKQAGSGSSSRSLPGKFNTSSKTSLSSEDSAGSLITIKVGGKMGRRSSKHKLGIGNSLAHRTSSVPYMNSFASSESAASIQQRREGNQQGGGGHNHQWS